MRTTSFFALFTLSLASLISAYDPVKMLCLVNQERAASGLAPLGLSKALENAAQEHSDDQARMRSMTHNGSDGSQPSSRVERAGYNWRSVAENVAYGYGDEEECMREWMNSPGHRQNILGASYTHFGSAVAYSGSTPYYTQNFAGDGGYHSFPVCPSGAAYDTSSGGGSAPSSGYNGGSAPSKYTSGGSSPSKYTSGGSSPSKYTSGGSAPTRYTSGGSAPSSNRRYTTKKRTTTYSKPVKSYGGDVQDSNTTRYGHRHSHGRRYGSKKPSTSYGGKKPTSNTKPTYSSKKPSSYGGAKPSSGSRPSSGGAYKTTTTYSKAA